MTQPSQFTAEQNEQADKRQHLQRELKANDNALRSHYPQLLSQRPGALERHRAFQQEERRLQQALAVHKAATPWVTEAMLAEADKRYTDKLFAEMFSVVGEPDENFDPFGDNPLTAHIKRKEGSVG